MSGRPETSTTLQDPNVEPAGSASATIALIGPNATHRRVMAKALLGTEASAVREFIDYPANLGDVAHLMEEHFDVVMIDVDSDQSYALQIIQSIAALNKSVVMAYSMRDDAELVRECMRAGARDFLPLPEEANAEPEPEIEPEALRGPMPEAAINPADFLRSPEPEKIATPEDTPLNPADFLLATPREVPAPAPTAPAYVPEAYSVPSRPQFVEPRRAAPQAAPLSAPPAAPKPAEVLRPEVAVGPQIPPEELRRPNPVPKPPTETRRPDSAAPSIQPEELRKPVTAAKPTQAPASPPSKGDEIDAWDSVWIKPVLPGAGKAAAQSAPAVAEVPVRKTPGPVVQSGPQLVQRAAQAGKVAEPSAPAAAPLFRAVEPEPEAQAQRKWVRWAILIGAPVAIVGLVMMIFMPSHRASGPATPQAEPLAAQTQPAPAQDAAPASLETRSTPKPSAATPIEEDQPRTAPVSSAMMDAQLNAPSRIALKKPSGPTEDAPGAFSPGAIDSGNGLPGQVFGGTRSVKVVPGVSAISAGVAEGMLLHKTAPVYPQIAKTAHVSGTVVLGANITKSGSLTNLHVLSGPAMLRDAALEAVKTWRYRPYLLNNQPVEVETMIHVVFSIN
jgi:periplasmic protein TonB